MNKTFLSFLKFEAQRVVLRDFSHLLQQYTNADTRPRPGSWKYLQWKFGCAGKNNETKSEPLFPGRSPVFDHTKANRIYPEEQSNLKID